MITDIWHQVEVQEGRNIKMCTMCTFLYSLYTNLTYAYIYMLINIHTCIYVHVYES